MKSGGFNPDATRLSDPKRINEMQLITTIKAHGRKAISFIHLALRAWVKIATLAIHQNNHEML
jgi:hypothetical protein